MPKSYDHDSYSSNSRNGKSSQWRSASRSDRNGRSDRDNSRGGHYWSSDRDERSGERRGGFRGDRRDDRRGGFRNDRRDGDRRGSRDERRGFSVSSDDYRSNDRGVRRDDDRRGGFRDERRDDRRGGFRNDRRDNDRRGGFRGDRRDDRRGGFGGERRDNDRRDDRRGGFRNDRRDDRRNNDRRERGHFNERDERMGQEKRARARSLADEIPSSITAEMLPEETRRHLRGLNTVSADLVARHLAYSGEMMDIDPEVAYQHAKAAYSMAARIDIVREAVGIAAYVTGRYSEALTELRAYRRFSDDYSHVAIEADSERGLGRSEKALRFISEVPMNRLDGPSKVELAIVTSGARSDVGDYEGGLNLLEKIIVENLPKELAARVQLVKADRLEELGRTDEAAELRAQWQPIYDGDDQDIDMLVDLNDVLDDELVDLTGDEDLLEDAEDFDDADDFEDDFSDEDEAGESEEPRIVGDVEDFDDAEEFEDDEENFGEPRIVGDVEDFEETDEDDEAQTFEEMLDEADGPRVVGDVEEEVFSEDDLDEDNFDDDKNEAE